MEITVVSGNYKTPQNQVHVFLDNVVTQLVNSEHKCNVIAPQSLYAYTFRHNKARKFVSKRITKNGKDYMVYSPIYFVWPAITIFKIHFADFSKLSYYRAVRNTYKKQRMHADCVYSHFMQAGFAAVRLARWINVPSYIANGEADTIKSVKPNSCKLIQDTLNNVTGIISVSSKCKNEISVLCKNNPKIMNKVTVIPNAIDETCFYKKNKIECRKELGFPQEKFIVAFLGSFIDRKGTKRLSHVLDRFMDVNSIFIGTGPEKPNCKNILFCGKVNNSEIIDYLNAADIFVLPTLAEGCCNAIVEAMACGLPIISSNKSFNWDILDDSCSIMVNPLDEEAIYNAICLLKEDKILVEKLSKGSLKKAESLTLTNRVNKILNFIQRMWSYT